MFAVQYQMPEQLKIIEISYDKNQKLKLRDMWRGKPLEIEINACMFYLFEFRSQILYSL